MLTAAKVKRKFSFFGIFYAKKQMIRKNGGQNNMKMTNDEYKAYAERHAPRSEAYWGATV